MVGKLCVGIKNNIKNFFILLEVWIFLPTNSINTVRYSMNIQRITLLTVNTYTYR